jgi:hypothetical protein
MATANSISEKPPVFLPGGFVPEFLLIDNGRNPDLLAVRQCSMRELTFRRCNSLQALIADKIASSALTRVRLAVCVESGSIAGAVVDVDVARARLAVCLDPTRSNPAVIRSAGAVGSEKETIGNAASGCATSRVHVQLGSGANRRVTQAHDGVVEVGC